MNVADEKTSQTWIRLHCRGVELLPVIVGVVARDDGKSMGNFRHQLVGGFNHLEKYYGYSNLEHHGYSNFHGLTWAIETLAWYF